MARGSLLLRLVIAFSLLAPIAARAQNITTVVGGGPNGTPATASAIGTPAAVVSDSNGNFFIADVHSNRVYEVSPSGTLTIFAGTGVLGYAGDGAAAVNAELGQPTGLAVDSSNNIYIADSANNVIRKVVATYPRWAASAPFATGAIIQPLTAPSPQIFLQAITGGTTGATEPTWASFTSIGFVTDGTITWKILGNLPSGAGNISTVAGTGTAGFTGNGGAATSATLNVPQGVAVDSNNNIFIADTNNNMIREVTVSNGNIQGVAGNGTAGYLGDNAAATSAEMRGPTGVYVDAPGNIFIADKGNNVIREVTIANGNITTVAGNGTAGILGDNGPATSAQLNGPSGVRTDSNGDIFIADTNNSLVREVTAGNSIIKTVAGNGVPGFAGDGSQAVFAQLSRPRGVFLDSAGDIFISDSGNSRVRDVLFNGTIHTFAGNGTLSYSGDTFPGTSAAVNFPSGVGLDGAGDVFVADTQNNVIRELVAATSVMQTVAGRGTAGFSGNGTSATNALLNAPAGVFSDGTGNIFIADTGNNLIREVLASTGNIQTVAGGGPNGDGGLATQASLASPKGVFVDRLGNIFIADTGDNRVREVIASTGIIQTIAGTGTSGFSGDNGPATSAQLHSPNGVAVDLFGNVFIADTGNNVVREVLASNHNIVTYAGNGTAGFSGDGNAATSAELNSPVGVVLDASGDLFIADTNNNAVREVNVTNQNIQTVAGNGTASFSGDGGPGTSATLNSPRGVAISTVGGLFIADAGNNRIREIAALVSVSGVKLSASTLSFGTIVTNTTSAPQSVTITNTGSAPLEVAGASITGANIADFAATNNCSSAVTTNNTCSVSVTFTPQSSGPRSATLNIADNAPGSPHQVTLSGTGAGAVTLSPSGLTFPLQIEGQASQAQTITVTNNQTVLLNIFGISIGGAAGSTPASFTQTNTCGGNLAAGASCVISVTFNPTVPGSNSAVLSVSDDATNGSPANPTIQTAGLSGLGTQAVVSLNPATLTFGTTVVSNSSATQTVTVTNKGVGALNIASIAPSATTADFTQTNNCGATLATNSSCTITITFTPVSSGVRTGSIVLTDNAGDSPQSITLTGNALDFSISTASSSSSSQTVTAGNTANYVVLITATGGATTSDSVLVKLTCAGAPAGSTCVVAPSQVTVTPATAQQAQVNVTTTVRPSAVFKPPQVEPKMPFGVFLAVMSFAIALLLYARRMKIAKRRGAAFAGIVAMCILAIAPALFIEGCNKTSTTSSGTLAGNYSLTITGANNGDSRSLVLTLIVN